MPDDDLQLRPATRRRPVDPVEPGDAPSLAERLVELQAAADAAADEAAADASGTPDPDAGRVEAAAHDGADEARHAAPETGGAAAAGPPAGTPAEPADGTLPSVDEAPAPTPAVPVKKAAKKAAAKKAPAKKAPAKRAPVKKAPAKRSEAPAVPSEPAAADVAEAVTEAMTEPAPAATAEAAPAARLAPPAVPRVMPAEEPPAPRPAPETAETPVAVDVVPPRRGGGLRALMVLTVLLLAAAVGMGAAAGVLSGPETWESTAAVRVVPRQAGTAVSGLEDYRDQVAGLTTDARGVAGVPEEDVREDLAADLAGTQIRVTAAAAHADQAELMAAMGAERLVSLITRDQQESVPLAADRLRAQVSASASEADRTEPSVAFAAGAGGLTAGGVLLLGLLLVFRPKKSAR